MVGDSAHPSSLTEFLRGIQSEFYPAADPSDPRARKRLRILQAARTLFIKHGYRKTSVEDVAAEAAVAKGTVYLYFERKVDLLVQAVILEKQSFIGQLEPVLAADLPPRERLRGYLRLAMILPSQMPLVSRLVTGDRELQVAMRELDDETSSRIDALRMDFLARLLGPASAGVWSEPELADRARALAALLFTAPFADESFRGGLSLERYAEIVADILVDGVLPHGGQTEGRG